MDCFGFIHEKLDIKILILFVLSNLDEKVNSDILTDLCLCDEGISYFDYSECLQELVDTGHITLEDGLYEITEKGVKNGELTASSLPYSIRIKLERQISILKQQLRRSAMIKAESSKRDGGGYTVSLTMSDGLGEILSLELFAGDKYQADCLCAGFKTRAEEIYGVLISEILDK